MSNDRLGDNEEETLRMQNELLRLKLLAETGMNVETFPELDPSLENEFLNNMSLFESSYANAKRVKIFDFIGRPDFKPVDNLDEGSIIIELERLVNLMGDNRVEIYFSGDYPNKVKYAFITQELFDKETDDIKVPGLTTHFHYEEFHLNHKLDIKNRAEEFLSAWFKKDANAFGRCLADQFILPDGKLFGKVEIIRKLSDVFDSYTSFNEGESFIADIGFQLNEENGFGHAEGAVRYSASLENQEDLLFTGPFKLYFEYQYGWWSIFYAVFPGLAY